MAAKKTVKSKAGSDNDVGEIEDTSADLVLDPRVEVSLATLERCPQRVTKFLAAMAASGQIRALMAERGWSEAKMLEGRSLLMDLLVPAPSAEQLRVQNAGSDSDQKVVAAQKSLNALDEGHFEIAQTALLYNHPAVYDFVFHNLAATTDDAEAVAGWRTFLTRVAILRNGEGRESTKKDDQAALALLAERGLHKEELDRIEALVRVAEGVGVTSSALDTESENLRINRLKKLWGWFAQWASVARVQVKGRAHRIRLGLAQRRSRKSPASAPDEVVDNDDDVQATD